MHPYPHHSHANKRMPAQAGTPENVEICSPVRPFARVPAFPHRVLRLYEVTHIDISLNRGSTFPGKKHIAEHLSL